MRILIATLLFTSTLIGYGQTRNDTVIRSSLERYDNSFITPSLRGKHSLSLGVVNVQSTPDANIGTPEQALHIGYNYLILQKRKLVLALKDKYRTEMNGIGMHLTYVNSNEHYLMGTFFHTYLAKKGRFISFYFLSEYGLGYHYKRDLQNFGKNKLNISILLEFLRFRIGRIPLYMNFAGTYAITNNLFNKTPVVLGYKVGIRYFLFDK